MTLKQIHSKKLLGRSSEQEELFNVKYTIYGISFLLGELEKLYKLDDQAIWQNILPKIKGLQKSLINYQSDQGLALFGKQFENQVLVVSAGEVNRDIYEIYIEGLWEIENYT